MLQISLFSIMLFLSINVFAKSEATLSFKMTPAGDFIATSQDVQGFAKMQGTQVSAENIVIPISSLDAGMELRSKHMKEKYLEMAKFPNAKLIKASGANGQGEGILEVHGVQKPVKGTYKIENNELVAEFSIKISDYNIQKVKYLGVGVNDEAKVTVRVPFKK